MRRLSIRRVPRLYGIFRRAIFRIGWRIGHCKGFHYDEMDRAGRGAGSRGVCRTCTLTPCFGSLPGYARRASHRVSGWWPTLQWLGPRAVLRTIRVPTVATSQSHRLKAQPHSRPAAVDMIKRRRDANRNSCLVQHVITSLRSSVNLPISDQYSFGCQCTWVNAGLWSATQRIRASDHEKELEPCGNSGTFAGFFIPYAY